VSAEASPPTPLAAEIARLIRLDGPLSVERYMALCLGHPQHGYYITRDPLGRTGDFTTAPEISQMFGELLGLWAAGVWDAMGRPASVRLVELGPGRGTLMRDALRAVGAALPAFRAAASVHLVETSPVLRGAQEAALAGAGASWHAHVDAVPDGAAIVFANEFFDALPVRQYRRGARGWHERQVVIADSVPDGPERLAFAYAGEPTRGVDASAPEGAILTYPAAALALVRGLAGRLARDGGALLAIDYGEGHAGTADTLQAVARHRFADPLAAPGEADLTTQVDFGALARAAAAAGTPAHGPTTQRDFLLALGLADRAERLRARATPAQAAGIEAAVARLTDDTPRGMGRLFKVLGLAGRGLDHLPGLPAPFTPP
jgi:NADH dehydrogenase [ubiquinone] 1 alpha subcomplex assembly factor 7